MTQNRGLLLCGVATAGFLAFGSGALAADIVAEPPAPEADWTAFHIGIGGGYGAVLHDGFLFVEGEAATTDEDRSEPFENFLQFDDLGDQAWLGTVEVGFDFQAGDRFVIGVFGDYTLTNFELFAQDELCKTSGDVDCVGKAIEIEIDDVWTVGGRIGLLSSPDTLWYVLGGYSNAKIDASGVVFAVDDEDDPREGFRFFDDDDRVGGFTVGTGVESMLSENVALKLEYRYSNFKNFGAFFDDEDCSGNCTLELEGNDVDIEVDLYDTDVDTTMHSIRAVLSYKLNWL